MGYSDTTPGLTYAYDRRGRQHQVTQGGAVATLGYNGANQLLSEAYTGSGILAGLTVANQLRLVPPALLPVPQRPARGGQRRLRLRRRLPPADGDRRHSPAPTAPPRIRTLPIRRW